MCIRDRLWEVLELLSIRQMKALGKLIDNRQTMEQPQLAGRRAQSLSLIHIYGRMIRRDI